MDRTYLVVCTTCILGVLSISLFLLKSQSADVTSGGQLSIYQPNLSIWGFPEKCFLFVSAIKRLIFPHVDRGVSAAIESQMELFGKGGWTVEKTKTIYFVRHGQSVWNATFAIEKGIIRCFFATIRLLFMELCLLVSNDTLMFDAPLTTYGIGQAMDLAKAIKNRENADNKEDLDVFAGITSKPSCMLTSNLRRAQSTALTVMHERIKNNKEEIKIFDELEEVAPNPDCISLIATLGVSTVPLLEYFLFSDRVRYYANWLKRAGIAKVSRMAIYDRILLFSNRIFKDVEQDSIIVFGHSRWFRLFFRIMMPVSPPRLGYIIEL
ncbi:Histidine phosphatase superfamily [Babesia duncani]|uniref:Histidine phosphatase superfamily n=1 Tax=Babesia duncani TaxID=323732 RepID=A0AAD9PI90_9APIC|nr:Histidine phosphatase superfamily [Babesia duncani]